MNIAHELTASFFSRFEYVGLVYCIISVYSYCRTTFVWESYVRVRTNVYVLVADRISRYAQTTCVQALRYKPKRVRTGICPLGLSGP